MLLICTNLLCPSPQSLSPFPLPSSSASLSLISCLQFLHREAEVFADRDVTKLVLWGKQGGLMRSLGALSLCVRIGSNVNSLISCLQTAGEGVSRF